MIFRIRFIVRPSASIHSQIVYAVDQADAVRYFKTVWTNATIIDVEPLPRKG